MRQTLFYIPHEILSVPVFGFGWALGAWLVVSGITLAWLVRRQGWSAETIGYLPVLAIFGVIIYAVLPMLEVKPPGMEPLGLPVRGYGVFVLLGIVAGVALSIYRARQIGMNPEIIYSLALWLFAISIAGARLFYVIQKWPEFNQGNLLETLAAILKFTEGGLVVYGSVVGGILALFLFSLKHRVSMLELGDVIAPGMALGLAFGRIGCLMNGCCYGAVCEDHPLGITFPRHASAELRTFSPPYAHQLASGTLYGFTWVGNRAEYAVIKSVEPGSAAERAGLRDGMRVTQINGLRISRLEDAHAVLASAPDSIHLVTDEGRSIAWSIESLPSRSLAVQPTQIYSSINAALICLVIWFAYPFRRYHGQVLIWLFVLYSMTRFLLESIRDDEVGQWGTSLTISQWVSLAVLAACIVAALWLRGQPPIEAATSEARTS